MCLQRKQQWCRNCPITRTIAVCLPNFHQATIHENENEKGVQGALCSWIVLRSGTKWWHHTGIVFPNIMHRVQSLLLAHEAREFIFNQQPRSTDCNSGNHIGENKVMGLNLTLKMKHSYCQVCSLCWKRLHPRCALNQLTANGTVHACLHLCILRNVSATNLTRKCCLFCVSTDWNCWEIPF